jgi:hypothetical protein
MRIIKIAAIALSLLASPVSASALFSGTYAFLFDSGPSHSVGFVGCFTFTQTSNVQGFPNSGTWTAGFDGPTGTGMFVVDGHDLRVFGTLPDSAGQ